MRRTTDSTWWTAAGLGAIAGARSMSAPALLGRGLSRSRRRRARAPEHLLASRRASRTLVLLAAGEMAADKLPRVPARTRPLPLAGRAASGALVGAGVAGMRRRSRLAGALLGAGAAVAAAYAMHRLRRRAGTRGRLPNAAAGLLEDGLVLIAGARLLDRLEP